VKFTAAAVQIAPKKGDYAANLARVAESALQASEQGADLAVFPETCLSGYFLEGGVADIAASSEQVAKDLWNATRGGLRGSLDVALGFYERAGGNLYNSAAHIELSTEGHRLRHVHRKFFLPTYGVFDEERFVGRGRDISSYETRLGRFALLICEDIWHSVSATIAALKGAQIIVAIAASPARGFSGNEIQNLKTYHDLLKAQSLEHGVWSVNSMLVGFEGGKGFTGGSVICDPFGAVVAEGPVGDEHMLLAEVDLDAIAVARQKSPLISDLVSVLEDITREIDEVNSNNQCP
jgi:N-carbamoylputrescine amidase